MPRTDPEFYQSTFEGSGAGMPADVWGKLLPKFTSLGGGDGGMGFGPSAGVGTGMMRGLESQTRPGMEGNMMAFQRKPRSIHSVPGPFLQTSPNTPAGMGSGAPGGLPALASNAAVAQVPFSPTGADLPAGSIMKPNYPNLRGLQNSAQGVYRANS